MKTHKLKSLPPLLVLLAFVESGNAAVIYSNPFTIPMGLGEAANAGLTATVPSWSAYTGAAAVLVATTSSRVWMGDRPFLDAPAETYGIVIMDGNGGNPKFFFTTTGVDIDPTVPTSEELTFSWTQGNGGDGSSPLRVAVQVDGQWYASSSTFTTAGQSAAQFGSTTSTTAEQKSLSFSDAAENWNTLSFTAGTALSLGGVAESDLTGNITGVGFFTDSSFNTNNIRLADFNITAIPEPSVAMLGTLLAGASLVRRRRA